MRAAEVMTTLVKLAFLSGAGGPSSRAGRLGGDTFERMSTTVTQSLRNFIDGEFVEAAEGATSPVLNPATGQESWQAASSGEVDVDRAVAAARRAFPGWAATTPGERAHALLKLADAIEAHGEELAELESLNAGKPIEAVKEDELPVWVDNLRFFAGAARTMEGKPAGEYLEGYTSIIRREPVGVVGQIAPWNYPLMMVVWKIGPALATGNTVVLKPAPATPVSIVRVAELAAEILPKGVLNVVLGGDDVGKAIVTHDGVDMVSITGSVAAGKAVAKSAADSLKRVHLELGGKAPVVVFDDVDLSTSSSRRSPASPTTTPARTAPPRRACWSRPSATTTSSPAWPTRPRATSWATRSRPTRRSARSTPKASAIASRASWSASRRTPRSSPAATSPTCPASTWSRPSSPTCARTTR